ncbi:hypothetical protein, partial [Vibrio parahaemolyticus]|uniref:hypothetical protein n=2 Tax=Vibrio TaxID=662 RepID=UPI001D15EC42
HSNKTKHKRLLMQNILTKALETLLRLGMNRSERAAILGGVETETKSVLVIELGAVLNEITVREPSSRLLGRRPIQLLKTGDVVLFADMLLALQGGHESTPSQGI